MTELHWYVVAARRSTYFERVLPTGTVDPEDKPTLFMLFRAYSWQDAFDQIRKDRYKSAELVWGLYPLEANGTYWNGFSFVSVDSETLKKAGFCAVEQPGSSPSS